MRPLKTLKKLYDEESHIVITEKGSPPRVMFYGEDFWVEDLPVGTRVIFPRPPLEGVPNLKAAIRYAINHPHGMDPLHALLKPDDIARARTAALYRAKNPAANHAAEAIVIYPTRRPGSPEF